MTQFLSTPSARRATPKYHEKQYNRSDFYPRPLRGGRPVNNGCSETPQQISIHALCEEGDPRRRLLLPLCRNFYPRPLRGGRRIPQRLIHNDRRFLSTPSARRATQRQHHLRRRRGISIHALCEEGDRRSGCTSQLTQRFLSTPSARRATRCTCPEAVAAYEFLSTPSARRATRQLSVKRSDQS